MAIKVSYVARETTSNLWRNLTLTAASTVTVAVSLALVGVSLLLRQGVENATARWKGGVEFIVFMHPEATPGQLETVQGELTTSPEVKEVKVVDQKAALAEFKQMFKDSPELVDAVDEATLPSSFRVVPRLPDADVISALGKQYEGKPGVREVVFAFDTIKTLQRLSRIVGNVILGIAVTLLVAAALLILNTIQMAMFARRREIEVMKLVGATNWFIRVPFMLEGLVQGVVGAALAVGAMWGVNGLLERWLSNASDLKILQSFNVAQPEVIGTSVFLLVIGCVIGALGSGIAVTRFLDV
ncbi:MAG: cell division protein FtsX [Acidimicrobiales bacterium]